MPTPLSILFAGAGAFGVPTLHKLAAGPHTVVGVISQLDKPAGRGKKLTPSAISVAALELGLPLIRTADVNNETLPRADVMVVIAFGQKIAPHVVNHPRFGSINLHASRLPKYRGAAPIHHTILNGETVTGNSVIRLANKMDAGAVLGMTEITIGRTQTTGELHDILALDGMSLIERVLNDLSDGTAIETEQDHSQATLAGKLSRGTTRIDWSRPAQKIADQIRALYPWPGCRVRIVDDDKEIDRLTIASALVPETQTSYGPGRLHGADEISCGGDVIKLLHVQPEGKRLMAMADYRNGKPWPAGARAESVV